MLASSHSRRLGQATLARARELALPLDLPAYAAVARLARARRSLAPLGYLRPADILLSAGGAVEPSVLEARDAAALPSPLRYAPLVSPLPCPLMR